VIRCKNCGSEDNQDDDDFCGQCGKYLKYTGEKIEEVEVAPSPQPDPDPDPPPVGETEHQGLIGRVKEKIGIGDDGADDTTAQKADDADTSAEGSANGDSSPDQEPALAAASAVPTHASTADLPTSEVAAPIVPAVAPADPDLPDQPIQPERPVSLEASTPSLNVPSVTEATAAGPVTDSATATRESTFGLERPVDAPPRPPPTDRTQPPQRELRPGDKVCDVCGEGNEPTRKFCHRCGASLAKAVPVPDPPWYKRWWQRLTHRSRPAQSTAVKPPKPVVRTVGSVLWKVLLIAVVLAIILIFVGPFHRSIHNRISDGYYRLFPHYTQVGFATITASASSQLPAHPAEMVRDNFKNTWWQASSPRAGQSVELVLSKPITVGKLGIIPPPSSPAIAQPRQLEVWFGSSQQTLKQSKKTVTLSGAGGSQVFETFSFDAKNTKVIKLVVTSTLSPGQTGLAEVEVYGKK
jgi:hypothetical protein